MTKYHASDDEVFRARAISIKEERAEETKHHLMVLWADFFTPDHVEQFPQLHDLFWRASQSVGNDGIYSFETEIGPDDAVHDDKGIVMIHGGEARPGKQLQGSKIYDVSSTVLDAMGFEVPAGMEGKVLDVAS